MIPPPIGERSCRLDRRAHLVALAVAVCGCATRQAPVESADVDDVALSPVQDPTGQAPSQPPQPELADPPSRKDDCLLLSCANALFLVGFPPGVWDSSLEASVCVGDRCDSAVLELPALQDSPVITDGPLIKSYVAPRAPCDALPRDCASTPSLRRVEREYQGRRTLVIVVETADEGPLSRPVRLSLTRSGKTEREVEEEVVFGSCHRPNGPQCEPECCMGIVVF